MTGPTGLVTLLFTDIEGSTRAWEDHPSEMQVALARHDVIVRAAIEGAGGHVFKTVGDAFCAAFAVPEGGLEAAVAVQRAVGTEPWPELTPIRVRIALHSAECVERDGDYFGQPVNRVARLEATAHGGQVVLTAAAVALVQDALPPGVTLRDMGEHRLKDLGRPEHVHQACIEGLPADFAPLRSLNHPRMTTNLPERTSTFVGRERELDELRAALGTSRLVTLTGAGGSGKTRLAMQVAADLLDGSGDGVWLADLAPLADAELVAPTVAEALGVVANGGRSMLDTLVEGLRDRRALLVLDNCEHVIGAVAELADALLGSCPGMELLATSREPIGIKGEHVYRVPSLVLPEADEGDAQALLGSEAVVLFLERAQEYKPGFVLDESNGRTVGRLVRRLDGIPLALELAAARLGSLSVEDLERRLDQRFRLLTGGRRTALARHQTLGALIDWSYDLLTPPQQLVLDRLSVFAGGWELEAAEVVVAGDDMDSWEVLDHLGALVDKSLVQLEDTPAGTVRYRLSETVREYAAVKLTDRIDGVAGACRLAHRDHFIALAERAAPHLVAADQVEWMGRLDRERDNLRVAFHECLGVLDPRPGLRLAGALCAFWVARNAALEVSDALAGLLARPEAQEPTPERGWAAVTLVELLSLRGGQHAVGVWGEAAKAIGRAHGDIELEVTATRCLSVMHRRQGDLDQAEAFGREALALGPAGSVSAHLRAILLMNMANVLDERCLVDAAREHMEEARRIAVQSGDEATLAMILNNLGVELLVLGELGPARAALADSLAIALRIEDGTSIRCANVNLGFAEIIEGDRPGARRFAVEMLAGARRAGDRVMVATGLLLVALARGDDAVVAARLHGAVDQRMEESGETFEQLEATLRARDQERLRDELGVEGFAIAHRDGRSLSSEAALALSSPDAPA